MSNQVYESAVIRQLEKSAECFFSTRKKVREAYNLAKNEKAGEKVLRRLRGVQEKLLQLRNSLDAVACEALPDYSGAIRIFAEGDADTAKKSASKSAATEVGEKEILTKEEAAAELSVGIRCLEGLMRRRAISFHRISSKCVRFSRTDLETFLKKVTVQNGGEVRRG